MRPTHVKQSPWQEGSHKLQWEMDFQKWSEHPVDMSTQLLRRKKNAGPKEQFFLNQHASRPLDADSVIPLLVLVYYSRRIGGRSRTKNQSGWPPESVDSPQNCAPHPCEAAHINRVPRIVQVASRPRDKVRWGIVWDGRWLLMFTLINLTSSRSLKANFLPLLISPSWQFETAASTIACSRCA